MKSLDSFSPLQDFNETGISPWVHTVDHDDMGKLLDNEKLLQSYLYTPKLKRGTNSPLTASGLLISYGYYSPGESEHRWAEAISSLLGENYALENATSSYTLLPKRTLKKFDYLKEFGLFPSCPFPVVTLILAYVVALSYLWIALSGYVGVLSQAGLAIAFLVQTCLSTFSALTIASVSFPSFSQYHIRQFMALPYLASLMGAEHTLRLVNSITKTPSEHSPLARISAAVEMSAPKAIHRVIISCLILSVGCIPYLGFSDNSRALCLFIITNLSVDLALHLSFFIAVLSVDLRRLEIRDPVNAPSSLVGFSDLLDQDYSYPNNWYGSHSLSKDLNFHIRAFVYFRRIYLKQWIPQITMFASCASIVLYLFGISKGFIDRRLALENPTGRFAYFMNPLITESDNDSHNLLNCNALIFEPIVIFARYLPYSHNKVNFSLGHPLNGSLTPTILDSLSFHLILEFVASLAFILSFTGIILRFLLPGTIEIPDDQEFSDTPQFFSKDLIAYHGLDILRIMINGPWICTLSLDHNLYIWNAARGDDNICPLSIPLSDKIWPIFKVVVNGNAGLIALFTPKVPGILVWNFKKNYQQYFIRDESLLCEIPVDSFFSGNDLIVITPRCKLLSIPPDGKNIKMFSIDLPDGDSKLTSATRLLSPKIHEQVVCVSSANDIVLGTHQHVSGNWTFEKLDMLESMAAIPKQEREPIFSSQFTDKFSVQKSLESPPLDNNNNTKEKLLIPSTRPIKLTECVMSIIPVPDIHMVLLATQMTASLVDVQTGTILQHFRLGHFKKGSLKVFHSQPIHCRFCGCASIESISVAYQDAEEDSTVIVHTLNVENRAKNNVCLRVERDPREKRCLGFEAATEHQHWIDNVEGWDITDMNMVMGVRRKDGDGIDDGLIEGRNQINYNEDADAITSATERFPSFILSRRRRKLDTNALAPGSKSIWGRPPPLNSSWEGWAMSATGQVSFYDIPDYQNGQRLLIESIGPVIKYGRKSIAVAFGNVIKILYFGNEESFLVDIEECENNNNKDSSWKSSNSPLHQVISASQLNYNQGAKKWRRAHF